jgi:hypothetical protein
MALTSDQQAVFALAVEKIETEGTKAMDHASHQQVQSCAKNGAKAVIDWAVDYLGCLPNNRELARLVARAHMRQAEDREPWTARDIRRCGGACRGFYSRIHARRLYGQGLRFLEFMGV